MLYFGPEVMMPLASLAAGAAGLVLMFWRRVVGVVRRAYRAVTGLFGSDR